MNIYNKMNNLREDFHNLKLEKTGWNDYSKYKYFELSDFLIPALQLFKKHGLFYYVSFTSELAIMTIVDVKINFQPGEFLEVPKVCDNLVLDRSLPETIVITSPMGSANLKACHEVQNIGAVETYQRRYLLLAALEIVEHDAIDSSDNTLPNYSMDNFKTNEDWIIKQIDKGKSAHAIINKIEHGYIIDEGVKEQILNLDVDEEDQNK